MLADGTWTKPTGQSTFEYVFLKYAFCYFFSFFNHADVCSSINLTRKTKLEYVQSKLLCLSDVNGTIS